MLAEFYFPNKLSAKRLDKYLAAGWFRSIAGMAKFKMIEITGMAHSVINIRSKLTDCQFSKSLRKISRTHKEVFSFEIKPIDIDVEKERLYRQHHNRFEGFVAESLEQFMEGSLSNKRIFNTYEVCVYHHKKLVACSFFDLAANSLASILGIYDQTYHKYSLGLFTMLLEMEFGIEQNKKFYYPGYVLHQNPIFDYKLRLPNLQYFNWRTKWKDLSTLKNEIWLEPELQYGIEQISEALKQASIPHQLFWYPYFGLGYGKHTSARNLRGIVHWVCYPQAPLADNRFVVEWLIDEKTYRLGVAHRVIFYQFYSNLLKVKSELVCDVPLFFENIILESQNAAEIISSIHEHHANHNVFDKERSIRKVKAQKLKS